ncbi:MAG: hypothetical protein CMJ71_04155 [Planctomycetaceae bacterium]|nr:hypothetical protein [Planctomycetaceae bacterium]
MLSCFWSSVAKWFHKWGNHGGNSDVLGGSLPAGRRGHGLKKCPRYPIVSLSAAYRRRFTNCYFSL